MSEADVGAEQSARMRAGIRRGVLSRVGGGLRRVSPPALLAVLCASAFGPVVAAAVGAGSVVVAGIVVFGSVGAQMLSDVIASQIDRWRAGGGKPTQAEFERALAERIERHLSEGGPDAGVLRADIAAVLRHVDAAGAALEAAVHSGDEGLQRLLTTELAELSGRFGEFGFVLEQVRRSAGEIQEILRQQNAESRADRDRAREQGVQLRLIRELLTVISSSGGVGPPPAGPAGAGGTPYRGLLPFHEDDQEFFFGRERVTAELVDRLAERLTGVGLLVVTGASGAGKSSLLRAGLMVQVARGALAAGSQRWPRMVVTPTASPLDELSTHLAVAAGVDPVTVRRALAEDPSQVRLYARQAALAVGAADGDNGPARLVLVVDQFEELYTLPGPGDDPAAGQREAFLASLCAAATPADGGGEAAALVVLAVRADYLDRCAAHPGLLAALRAGVFFVGAMTGSELRQAVVGPADAAGLVIEPGLVDTILADLRGAGPVGFAAAALPLLSQAMLVTWQQRDGDRLTSRGYDRAGGVVHAVRESAEAAYASLSAAQQPVARRVLQRLTVVAGDGQLARRRMPLAELRDADAAALDADVDAVVAAFTGRRLLVVEDTGVEISHDALLTHWPRLRDWLRAEVADWAAHSQILEDAMAWRDHDRDTSRLYRGGQLAAAKALADRWRADPGRYPSLTPVAGEFLVASTQAARRGTRIRRLAVAGLVLLTVAATGAAGVAYVNAAQAVGGAQQRGADHVQAVAAVRQQFCREHDVGGFVLVAVTSRSGPPEWDPTGRPVRGTQQRTAAMVAVAVPSGSPRKPGSGRTITTCGISPWTFRIWLPCASVRIDVLTRSLTATMRYSGRPNEGEVRSFSYTFHEPPHRGSLSEVCHPRKKPAGTPPLSGFADRQSGLYRVTDLPLAPFNGPTARSLTT